MILYFAPGLSFSAPRAASHNARLENISQEDSGLADEVRSLKPKLQRTVVESSYVDTRQDTPTKEVLTRLRSAIKELKANQTVLSVGIWDLHAYVGELPMVISNLNDAQQKFAFFEVKAPVPAGLISDPQRVTAWAKELGKKLQLPSQGRDLLPENTFAEDYYPQAEKVRKQIGLDFIVGITRSLVAFEANNQIFANFFTAYAPDDRDQRARRELLVSTYGLHEYSEQSGRPFEAILAGIAISRLLIALSPKLIYHRPSKGCLFDLHADRDSIVKSITSCYIEPECKKLIKSDLREPAEALVEALKNYRVATQ